MKREQQLRLLATARARREQQAAARATAARAAANQQRQQLAELEAWQADYRQNGPIVRQDRPVSVAELNRWRQFVSGMDGVINQQREMLAESEAGLAASIEDWRHKAVASQAIDTLRKRLDAEQLQLELQSEQEDQDDRAGHGASRREER